MNPPAEAGAPDGSSLCRECGICCGWSIFGVVGLQFGEVEWASSKHLPIVQRGQEVSFKLPCSVLESHGDERVCGDYEHRPSACRSFECKVLARYKSLELSRADALGLVKKARALIASIEESVARAHSGKDLSAKLNALALAFREGSVAERMSNAETLLDLGVLQALVLPAFHEHRSQETASAAEVTLLLEQATHPDSWRQLFAATVSDGLPDAPSAPALADSCAIESSLRSEGYARLGTVLTPDEASGLASLVAHLTQAGWPAVFSFMHPAIWNIPHRLEKLLTCLLGDGYGLLSAFWAWRLAPGTASCGWPPHRDRAGITVQKDGTPNSITVWIALTNATPENGCIYVVPPECDPYYGGAASSVDVHDVQNVRAIPAQAGRALAWNHQLLHWGGTIARATEARVSIAFEFRRADALDTTDTIDRGRIPGFADRLKLIARQILEYKRFESIDRRFVDLATQLLSRGPADTPP